MYDRIIPAHICRLGPDTRVRDPRHPPGERHSLPAAQESVEPPEMEGALLRTGDCLDVPTVGCFIFSPFLKLKMLGVVSDGVFDADFEYVIFISL